MKNYLLGVGLIIVLLIPDLFVLLLVGLMVYIVITSEPSPSGSGEAVRLKDSQRKKSHKKWEGGKK